VKKTGLIWGRRAIGVAGLGIAAISAIAVMFTEHRIMTLILLSLTYGGITFQQPIMFAVSLDIGGEYAGTMVGAMNTAAQFGSFITSLVFGYLVDRFGSYNAPFIPMAVLLAMGAWLWTKVDPSKQLAPASAVATQTIAVPARAD
jgi:predicted MFS family arabinose efflux permease